MKCRALFSALALAGLVCAQTPPAPPGGGETKPSKVQTKIDQRAEKMREEITEGRPVKSHVKVRVRLNNGNRLIGVVKDGRLVERVDGLRFVDAHAKDAGAGIRLWYSGGTRNYVFVPFRSLKNYEVLQRLSHKQLMELEQELQMAEKRAEEREAERARRAKGKAEAGPDDKEQPEKPGVVGEADGKPATDPGQQKKAEGQAAMEAARAELRKTLLAKYPPKDGWNTAKRDEIKRRKVVIGATPSEFEMGFVKNFEEWNAACLEAGLDPDAVVEKAPETRRDQRKAERDRLRGR